MSHIFYHRIVFQIKLRFFRIFLNLMDFDGILSPKDKQLTNFHAIYMFFLFDLHT